MNTPAEVFCSYSRDDELLYNQFEAILVSLRRQGIVREWHSQATFPEVAWQSVSDQYVNRAELVILLVSPSFLSSGYCSGLEMSTLLARHDAGEALVIGLIVRPCIWQATPLGHLKVLPMQGIAVTCWENRDLAWSQVEENIREAVNTPLPRPFYRELCEKGRKALLSRTVDIVPFLDDLARDKRLGLTLIVRPSQEVAVQLTTINDQLNQTSPRHFYYGQPRFHFTILSMVNAVDPPAVSIELASRYVRPIEEVLRDSSPFEVEFSGICATPNSFIAKGFPIGDGLNRLRDALRQRLGIEGLGASLDERYRIQGAHITMGRFRVLEDFSPLIKTLDQLQDIPLGSMIVQRAQLVINDFYMSPEKVQAIAEFSIGSAGGSPAPARSIRPEVTRPMGEKPQVAKELLARPATAKDTEPPTVGIVTALTKEYVALKAIIENQKDYVAPGTGAGRRYLLGTISGFNGTRHSVVLCLADIGNNIAATRATLLMQHFPSVKSILMVGIAGGVPYPEKLAEHVRLGDVVVSDRGGVVQYDFDKETIEETIHRHPPRPPSSTLLEGVRLLQVAEMEGRRPWQVIIDRLLEQLRVTRPPEEMDVLASTIDARILISHPEDPDREKGQPKIFMGPIASANKLLKNPLKRDTLRDKFGAKAIEMESSGIADATWNHEVGYLVVRGICDYCDSNKGDGWQKYAAVVAAAYTRALLESVPGQATDTPPRPELPPVELTLSPPSPPRVLNNLKMKRTNVVGRQEELQYILRSLGKANKPVILTSGFGGIGKSTLAKMVAWTCTEQQRPFDFIAWVDLRQYGKARTISLNYILDEIAKVADVNSDIPAISHLETKQDRVRELLKSHRSFLILDNYEDLLADPEEEQKVCAFLDSLPAGQMRTEEDMCICVLITTREISTGLRALPIDELRLRRLSLEDSLIFMKSRSPDHVLTDDQYKRIWELLYGLPKYMEIAIDQLRNTNFEQWERIATHIEVPLDAGERFFRDLFEHSWGRFSDEFRKILMSLTYFVGEASSEALQATSGLSERAFVRALASASDAYIESTGTGYTAHPLTHTFCRAILDSTDAAEFREESGRRFVEYYVEFAKTAQAEHKTEVLEREIRNLVATARLATKLELWERLIKLRESVSDFLRFRGYWHEQVEIAMCVIDASREMGNERLLAECLVHDLAWYLLRLEDLEHVEKYITEGVLLFEKLGDHKGLAQGKRHLGKSALLKGLDVWYEPDDSWAEHSPNAERYYEESLRTRKELTAQGVDQRSEIADMKLDFGRLYWLQGKRNEYDGRRRNAPALIAAALKKYEEAGKVSWEAIAIFEEIHSARGIAKALGNLGNATKEIARFMLTESQSDQAMQRIAEAHEFYERSLEIAKRIGRRDEVAHACWGLAEVYELYADHPDLHCGIGDRKMLLEKALEYAEESYGLYTFLGGGKDIKATDRLVHRIGGKLSPL